MPHRIIDLILLREVDLLTWLNLQHLYDFHREFGFKPLLFLSVILDSPKVQLLRELLLIVGVLEFWVHLAVVSQVVDDRLEGQSIAIEENGIVYLLQVVHTREHLLQGGPGHAGKHLLADHYLVGASDVQLQDIAVEAVLGEDESLLILPRLLFCLYLVQLYFQLLLSILILLRNHVVILLDCLVEIPELLQLIIEELLDLEHILAEVPFDGVYTCPELLVGLLGELRKDLKVDLHGLLVFEMVDGLTYGLEIA